MDLYTILDFPSNEMNDSKCEFWEAKREFVTITIQNCTKRSELPKY